MADPDRPRSSNDFEIALICALTIEADAVVGMFDRFWDADETFQKAPGDDNAYTTGRIGRHDVVVAHMPSMGKASSATTAANLRATFNNIKLGLVVGVCGGVPVRPSDGQKIRLGDVVISTGVVQFDFGRQLDDGVVAKDTLEDNLGRPNREIRAYLQKLQSKRDFKIMVKNTVKNLDVLLSNDDFQESRRPEVKNESIEDHAENSDTLTIHFGRIGSGDVVMKSKEHRDYAANEKQVIAYEMEAAGVWDNFPTVVIKSVCDYADASKNKDWQRYAAASAAACMKAFLQNWKRSHKLRDANVSVPVENVHFTIVRPQNPLFTGRQHEINRILEALRSPHMDGSNGESRRTFVITGLAGQGKSEISIRIADILRNEYWGVFWVDVSTQSAAEKAFVAIAKLLGSETQDFAEATQILAATDNRWLLILDNADDPRFDYQTFIPPGTRGSILLTSRNPECCSYSTVGFINLQGLEIDSSTQLLLKAAKIPDSLKHTHDTDAREVAELLSSHALALVQAGAYIGRGHCTLSEYPSILQQQRGMLLQYRPAQSQSRYRDIYATFEASAEILTQSGQAGKDSIQLLEIFSRLHFSPLPMGVFKKVWEGSQDVLEECQKSRRQRKTKEKKAQDTSTPRSNSPDSVDSRSSRFFQKIFHRKKKTLHQKTLKQKKPQLKTPQPHGPDIVRSWDNSTNLNEKHVRQLPDFISTSSEEWDQTRLTEAISLLMSLSLVQKDEDSKLSMHPLTHAWALDRQTTEKQKESWIQAGCFLTMSYEGSVDFWQKQQRQLRSHILAFLSFDIRRAFSFGSQDFILEILVWCGYALYWIDETERLNQLLEDIFQELELQEDTVDSNLLDLFKLRAWNCDVLGQVEQELNLLKQVVKIQKSILAKDNSERLASEHSLALAYLGNGQVMRAVELLEQIVEVEKTTIAEDHPDRLTSQQELAKAYLTNGQVEEGLKLLEHVVKVEEEKLAEDHPDRLSSQHELSRAYQEDKQITRAIELLEHVVKVRATSLPEDNSNRLASQHELARAYKNNGQLPEAIELIQYVVKVKKQAFPKDHPILLNSIRLSKKCFKLLAEKDSGNVDDYENSADESSDTEYLSPSEGT